MHIELIAVGHKMPDWVTQGFNEYRQRMQADVTLSLTEIPLQKRGKASQLASARAKESEQVMKAIDDDAYVVTLDIPGKVHSSESLADRLRFWQENTRKMVLIIGGPEGLSAEMKARANESWSLGKLTLPHPLVRIVAAEALYRAWSINNNLPYHRA